jgi:ubiquinone/menaquinone biosynthesis C-methylase UbiE
LKQAAMLVPPIRRLKEERDAALKEVAELSRQLAEFKGVSTKSQMNASCDLDGLVDRSVERALSIIRAELTPLPRFAYHLPLDHETLTLPPKFDPPIWVDGEALPLPPSVERHGHDDSKYLEWGRYDHDILFGHIRRELPSIDKVAVMDFGCSSGRVLRHFLPEMREHGWKLIGVDVSARRIEWMRRNFPPDFQVYTGSILPILPFESNSVDVIYGLSVFTHMKFLWDMWLLELRRVLKPGGLLIQTVHTENAWNFFAQHGHLDWARSALGQWLLRINCLMTLYISATLARTKCFGRKRSPLIFGAATFQM